MERKTDMDEFKTITQSKTFWGAIVAMGGAAISASHYAWTPADAAVAVNSLVTIAGAIGPVISGVGALVTIYGRVVASKKIGSA
jgi:hypothetical protein